MEPGTEKNATSPATSQGPDGATQRPGCQCPADLRPLEPVAESDQEAIALAVARARQAQSEWGAMGLRERIRRVEQLTRRVLERRDEVLSIMVDESGRSRTECLMTEVAGIVEMGKSAARIAKKALAPERIPISRINYPGKKAWIEAVPRGVVGIIAPWNYPLGNFYKPLFPALYAGNGVVLKPSEHTPRTGAWLASVCEEILPAGLVGCVQGGGSVGAALLDAGIDAVVFTGSVATGKRVAAAAAERLIPCSAELGGKDAAIVLADCHFERTVAGVAQWAIHNAGHNCAAIERVLVEEAIADRFVAALGKLLEGLRVAPTENADLGPIQNAPQLALIERHVAEAIAEGATLVCGGERTGSGLGYRPTLLDHCTPSMRVWRDETFGPVIAVMRVAHAEDAIEAANRSEFGLNGSIWTRDLQRGAMLARRLEVGVALVNNHAVTGIMPELPWTGVKNTGFGVASSRHAYPTFVRRRALFVDSNKRPDPWWMPATEDLARLGETIVSFSLGSFASALSLPGLVGRRMKAIEANVREAISRAGGK